MLSFFNFQDGDEVKHEQGKCRHEILKVNIACAIMEWVEIREQSLNKWLEGHVFSQQVMSLVLHKTMHLSHNVYSQDNGE